MSDSNTPVTPKKGSLWRTIVAVAWSFLGVRKNSEFQEDIARITPLHILGVGLVAGLLFVIALMVIVNLVVGKS
jgi:amino acid transporter